MLSKELLEFLKTKEGKRMFRDLTPGLTKHQRQDLKNRMVQPPAYVLEWLEWQDKLEKEFSKVSEK